jgi:S1-C subfamily serine protease
MKVLPTLFLLMLSIGGHGVAIGQQAPVEPSPPVSNPLLRQLDDEVRRLYTTTADGMVRVRVPTRWLNPTAEWLRKWENKLAPQMRQRLLEQRAEAGTGSSTNNGSATTPTTPAATTLPGTTLPVTSVTTAPATQPQLAAALFPEMVDVAGLVIDDTGHILLGGEVDPAQAIEPATVRVIARDGATADASFVGTDSLSGLTLLRINRPPGPGGSSRTVGTPVSITRDRPVEGSLLVLTHAGEARLIVYTASTRESGVVVMPDGTIGVLRDGQFIGGPGYAAILDDLRTRGKACRPQLGLEILEVAATPDMVRLARPYVIGRKALFAHKVFDGLPAAKAGVMPGDLLIALGGRGVPDMPTLAAVLTDVHGSVVMTIGRSARQIDLRLDLPDPRADVPAKD